MSFELLGGAAAELIEMLVNREKPKPGGQIITAESFADRERENAPKPEDTPVVHHVRLKMSPDNTGAELNGQSAPAVFELNTSNIVQAIVFRELLNEPVCKRRRRWRSWS